jgi:hypothetical protein
MFGNNSNTTTDLMLPILLDMANLIRRAVRSGKQAREVIQPPQAQMLRRSFNEDDTYFDDDIDTEFDNITHVDNIPNEHDDKLTEQNNNKRPDDFTESNDRKKDDKTTTATPRSLAQRLRNRRISQKQTQANNKTTSQQQDNNRTAINDTKHAENTTVTTNTQDENVSMITKRTPDVGFRFWFHFQNLNYILFTRMFKFNVP